MPNKAVYEPFETASHTCYVLLSSAEFRRRLVQLQTSGRASGAELEPLVVTRVGPHRMGYPAFQLDKRLNQPMLVKLRALYSLHQIADDFLWDFLRTRHKSLGGYTGVDFLLSYFTSEIAVMSPEELQEQFLELALEEIGRLRE